MNPHLTIGLPVFNAGPLLLDALRSIYSQSFQDWELIAIDDGSTDDSLVLLNSLRDDRVRIISDGRNLRLPSRLNQIAREARGQYIARMDADDMCHPDRLADQVAFLEEHPDVDVLGTGMVILDRQGIPAGLRIQPRVHSEICFDPAKGIRLNHASLVGKTSWFRDHPYNTQSKYGQDFELWMKSYRHSLFANLANPYYFYREFDSFSLKKYARSKRLMASVLWKYARVRGGKLKAARGSLRQFVELTVVAAMCGLGVQDRLVRRRSVPISSETLSQHMAVLDRIKSTELPILVGSLSEVTSIPVDGG